MPAFRKHEKKDLSGNMSGLMRRALSNPPKAIKAVALFAAAFFNFIPGPMLKNYKKPLPRCIDISLCP